MPRGAGKMRQSSMILRRRPRWPAHLGCVGLVVAACDAAPQAPPPQPDGPVDPAFLRKPFDGDYANGWPFDHDLPVNALAAARISRGSPGVLDWRGQVVPLAWNGNGHDGNDFALPRGTPVLAAAAGEVERAGPEDPTSCGDAGVAAAIIVRVHHVGPGGVPYSTLYAHLDELSVTAGDHVAAGQPVGLSGSTGCASGPHLHFGVSAYAPDGRRIVVDPFGWSGAMPDPWSLEPDGWTSTWLWTVEPPDGG